MSSTAAVVQGDVVPITWVGTLPASTKLDIFYTDGTKTIPIATVLMSAKKYSWTVDPKIFAPSVVGNTGKIADFIRIKLNASPYTLEAQLPVGIFAKSYAALSADYAKYKPALTSAQLNGTSADTKAYITLKTQLATAQQKFDSAYAYLTDSQTGNIQTLDQVQAAYTALVKANPTLAKGPGVPVATPAQSSPAPVVSASVPVATTVATSSAMCGDHKCVCDALADKNDCLIGGGINMNNTNACDYVSSCHYICPVESDPDYYYYLGLDPKKSPDGCATSVCSAEKNPIGYKNCTGKDAEVVPPSTCNDPDGKQISNYHDKNANGYADEVGGDGKDPNTSVVCGKWTSCAVCVYSPNLEYQCKGLQTANTTLKASDSDHYDQWFNAPASSIATDLFSQCAQTTRSFYENIDVHGSCALNFKRVGIATYNALTAIKSFLTLSKSTSWDSTKDSIIKIFDGGCHSLGGVYSSKAPATFDDDMGVASKFGFQGSLIEGAEQTFGFNRYPPNDIGFVTFFGAPSLVGSKPTHVFSQCPAPMSFSLQDTLFNPGLYCESAVAKATDVVGGHPEEIKCGSPTAPDTYYCNPTPDRDLIQKISAYFDGLTGLGNKPEDNYYPGRWTKE